MPLLKKESLIACLKAGLLILPFIINLLTLKDGHNWGDDFAQYILYAQNLMAGRPYTENIMADLPVVYPPLYALTLVPLLCVFGMNFIAFKALNVLFWAFVVWGAHAFFKLREDPHAWRNTLLVAWSAFFFYYKQNVLSDIFFAALVMAAILAYEYFQKKSGLKHFLWFLLAAVLAVWTRSAGICLFVAALIHLGLTKQLRAFAGAALALSVCLGLQKVFLDNQPGYWREILSAPWGVVQQVFSQAPLTWKALAWVFVPGHDAVAAGFQHVLQGPLVVAGWLLPLVMGVVLARKVMARSVSFTGIFFTIYMALIYLWTFFSAPPSAFARLLLPVYVPAVFYLFHYSDSVPSRFFKGRAGLSNIVFSVLIALNCWNIFLVCGLNDDVLRKPGNREMFSWVRANVPDGDVVMFAKPRALKLMTGKLSASYVVSAGEDPQERVARLGVRYIIMGRALLSDPLFVFLTAQPHRFKQVWSNGAYLVFEVSGG